jgi:MFS family permease
MTFGIFLLPVSETFGWTRDVLPGAYAVFTIFAALATPVVGRLIDRYDPRLVLGLGSCLFGLATASLALLTPSRPMLFALYAVWGLASAVQMPVGYTKIISAWFGLGRGTAMGLMLVGSAIGTVIIPVLSQIMIQTLSWRAAYVGLGAIVLIVSVPSIFGLIRRPPTVDDISRGDGSAAAAPVVRVRAKAAMDAIRSGKFWLILTAMFLVANVILGLSLHLFPILKDRGLSVPAATTAVTISGVAMMAGRLLGGFAMDHFPKEKVAAFFFVLPLGAIVALSTSSGLVGAVVAATIIGLCSGAEVAVASVLVADRFGLRAYGQIFSWIFLGFIFGSGSGPWLMAKSFVLFGSYQAGLLLLGAFAVTASVLIYTLGHERAEAELHPASP